MAVQGRISYRTVSNLRVTVIAISCSLQVLTYWSNVNVVMKPA